MTENVITEDKARASRASTLRKTIEGIFEEMAQRRDEDYLKNSFSIRIGICADQFGQPSIHEIESLLHDGEPIKGLSIDNVDLIAHGLASITLEATTTEIIDSIADTISDWIEAQRYPSFIHRPNF